MANIFKRAYWKVARVPYVTTVYGHDRCDALRKHEGSHEDERARAEWVEYHKTDPETGKEHLVHRSVNIQLKQSLDLGLEQGIVE